MVRDYGKQQRYTFMGPIQVHLERADDLDTGLYRVRSRTLATSESQGHQGPHQPHAQQRSGSAGAAPAGRAATATRPQPASPPPMPAGAAAATRRSPGCPAPADPSARPPAAGSRSTATATRSPGSTLVLGRSTEADVRIDDPGVSRRHCEIRVGSPSMVQDLGSTNGIVVDGQHTQRATLRDGSRIVVGSTTIVYRQAEG